MKKYRDTSPISMAYFCKCLPFLWQKVVYTPPIYITIRLPFASRYFCGSIRVRGRWDTPNFYLQLELVYLGKSHPYWGVWTVWPKKHLRGSWNHLPSECHPQPFSKFVFRTRVFLFVTLRPEKMTYINVCCWNSIAENLIWGKLFITYKWSFFAYS